MAKFIQSTLSAGIDFVVRKDVANSPVMQTLKKIHVNGGANVRDKNSIFTPKGALTEVSDEDYAILLKDPVFCAMRSNGFLVATDDHHLDVKDNKPADASAPKTPAYYEQRRSTSESPAPAVGAVDTEA